MGGASSSAYTGLVCWFEEGLSMATGFMLLPREASLFSRPKPGLTSEFMVTYFKF